VYFRQSCRQVAEAASVAGWVRNRPDGTVEAVFEGSAGAVERLVAWCGRGPGPAVVVGVDVVDEPVEGLAGFRVR
jgi:acylphosphatase